MTKITFFKRKGVYYGFREVGHSEFADEGHDIVCSALSAMTMLIINTVEVSYAARVDYTIDEKTTDVTVKIMSALPEYEKDEKKQLQYFFHLLKEAVFLKKKKLCRNL